MNPTQTDELERRIYRDGYAVLPSLISPETCDKLKKCLDSRFNQDLPYNYSSGHYLIYLPREAEQFPEEIVMNQEVHKLVSQILGPNYYMYSYNCNANLAEENQPFHMDCNHFHPLATIKKFGSPGPPHQIICNVYLQDTNEENGSLEMVSGSHLFTDFEIDDEGRIDPTFVPHSECCNLPKGSVVIRDKRTWHRGTKNSSGVTRYMIGCSYSVPWHKFGNLEFNQDCESFFEKAPFSIHNIVFQ